MNFIQVSCLIAQAQCLTNWVWNCSVCFRQQHLGQKGIVLVNWTRNNRPFLDTIGSGFGGPGGTSPPRIPRTTPFPGFVYHGHDQRSVWINGFTLCLEQKLATYFKRSTESNVGQKLYVQSQIRNSYFKFSCCLNFINHKTLKDSLCQP